MATAAKYGIILGFVLAFALSLIAGVVIYAVRYSAAKESEAAWIAHDSAANEASDNQMKSLKAQIDLTTNKLAEVQATLDS